MTTFTKISDDQTATLSIDPSRQLSPVNPNIYGGFIEHIGRCIYGGIYDPGNELSDEDGFRKDVIKALKELNVPVVRYPGGNFVSTYHWLDGVGPRDQRPVRPELAWSSTESNHFGTDEFMKWCKAVGTDPYLCLNFGTGTLDEALAWVEYCNSANNTYYANLRRKNGHEEPYNVKYWGLGNEMWGPWQVNQMTKEDYAKRAFQWSKALKFLDPSIELILCGQTGHTSWDHHVLTNAIQFISMHSIHIYTTSTDHIKNVTAPLSAERSIEVATQLITLARIENNITPPIPRQTICFDEWNIWDPLKAPGSAGAEQTYTLSDALAVAVWLNVFIRQSANVGMANIAQSVNVISPLMTTPTSLHKQVTWWPLLLFSRYMRGTTLGVHLRCGDYAGDTEPAWIRGTVPTPWLDVSAVLDEDGYVNLAVVNISAERDVRAEIEGVGEEVVEVFTVVREGTGFVDDSRFQGCGYTVEEWKGKAYVFLKHSFTLMRWKACRK